MFKRLKISSKLLLLVLALAAGMLSLGGYAMHALAAEQARAEQVLARRQAVADAVIATRAAQVAFKIQMQDWKHVLLRGYETAEYDTYVAAFREDSRLVRKELDSLEGAMAELGMPMDEVGAVRQLHAKLIVDLDKALERFDVQGSENTHAIDRAVRNLDRPMDAALHRVVGTLLAFAQEENERIAAASAAQARRATLVMVAVMAAVLLGGLAFGLWLARSITRPLQLAVTASQRVAAGDLTVQLRSDSRDELGQLLAAMSEMSSRLRAVLGDVVGAAHAVADSSAQIAQGNVDLSQRTEEQAGTLEETASQMEELTSTVTQNADHARQASQMAASAAEVASKGGAVVGQVVGTMSGISEASRRIADIIGVIDGIAFQTNILALNAAVEAARAGEQGRGFAVVAAEVRNLAQRSAAAAREIKGLIGDSVGRVDAGARLVADAGRTMEEIVTASRRVSALVAEIATACQEQSVGIAQVNTAVTQMDQVVQQNATLVEEATAATEAMKAQAEGLLQVVSGFRLDERAQVADAAGDLAAPEPARVHPEAPAQLPRIFAHRPALATNSQWREF